MISKEGRRITMQSPQLTIANLRRSLSPARLVPGRRGKWLTLAVTTILISMAVSSSSSSAALLRLISAARQNSGPASKIVTMGTVRGAKHTRASLPVQEESAHDQGFVTSDKSDYQPGETVLITGSEWQPYETVQMVLHREPLTQPDSELTATADEHGNIVNSTYV